MKKNSGYEINYIENTIIVTKSFLKEAGTISSAAYTQLAQLRRDLPDFQIIPREISKKQGKQTYEYVRKWFLNHYPNFAEIPVLDTNYHLVAPRVSLLTEAAEPLKITA